MDKSSARTVNIDIASRFDMIDMVQTIASHLADVAGLSEDAAHYMSVAVRESVVNAIKHGNRMDASKRVALSFSLSVHAIEVLVRDEGQGFDPEGVPNPLAEENLLKAYGRGIFFMRSFMDEVSYAFPKAGGTEVRMVKKF